MKEIEGVYAIFGDGKVHFVPDVLIPAIDEFVEQYKIAVTLKYVQKPVAYAMYHAWQEEDKKKARKNDE